MSPPTSIKGARNFMGVVDYYCNMWPRRSHTLSLLTRITSKKKIEWTEVEQDAFETNYRTVAYDTLSTYPDFNETFKIHNDTSALKLEAVMNHKVNQSISTLENPLMPNNGTR